MNGANVSQHLSWTPFWVQIMGIFCLINQAYSLDSLNQRGEFKHEVKGVYQYGKCEPWKVEIPFETQWTGAYKYKCGGGVTKTAVTFQSFKRLALFSTRSIYAQNSRGLADSSDGHAYVMNIQNSLFLDSTGYLSAVHPNTLGNRLAADPQSQGHFANYQSSIQTARYGSYASWLGILLFVGGAAYNQDVLSVTPITGLAMWAVGTGINGWFSSKAISDFNLSVHAFDQ